jgi:hypothetical protein
MRWFALVAYLLVAGATSAQARWLRAETPSFFVYSQGSEGSLRKQAEALQDFDALLRTVTGVKAPPSPTRVNVVVVRDNSQMYHFGTGGNVAGVYFSSPGVIAALVGRYEAYGRDTDTSVLFHEYAHHFMMQYAAASYPAWYTEGFASYLMTARIHNGIAEIGRVDSNDAYQLKDQAWMTLGALIAPGTNRERDARSDMFYPQAWVLVHYINADPERRRALSRYLTAVGKGDDPVKSFETAFETTLLAFQTALQDYARHSSLSYQRLKWSPPAATVEITALPAAADQLLLLDLAVRAGFAPDRPRLLGEVRRAAAAAPPGDPFAATALVRAEAELGDVQTALAMLTTLGEEWPDDPELLLIRGTALHRAAEGKDLDPVQAEALRKAARIALARANALQPDDYRILFGHTQVAPHPLSDSEMDVALLAHGLAPQVKEMAIGVARYQIERNERAAARVLLQQLASDAHDRRNAEVAAKLLAELDPPEAAR